VIKTLFYKERFSVLLVSILLYLLVAPFMGDFTGLKSLMAIFLSAILLSGVFAVSEQKKDAVIATLLAIPLLISIWLSHFISSARFNLLMDLFAVPFMLFTVVSMLVWIFKTTSVTRDVVAASIVVYLLMGLLWAFIYLALDILEPGSFSYDQGSDLQRPSLFSYYSFVTLTTLGYGDVTPLTPRARAFSFIEAIIGQMYIAILVARLVGLQVAQAASGNNTTEK